ncbi:MAG: T9SS type A sorting domain-containing protein [Flavobacterium sp.]|uniref:T9SS type A sorting domain-containing protein n=1 Tax=Flavobacterium sp. TaxID=239 RepID=UPI001225D097|nr:T9SS type A sorting domain-containing protein [Flavobacterium sp.]RZJ67465.1 MAG: T9SS type A sorting domain-containing protein [Flavobacterium sp.]
MKKITLFIFLLSATLSAQTTYNSADFAMVDETFDISTAGNFATQDFALAGPNQTWDFGSLTGESVEQISWINPNNTGYKTTWCLFNFYILNCNSQFNASFNLAGEFNEATALENLGVSNLMNHYFKSATQLESKMIGATFNLNGSDVPFTVDYTTPDIVYEFPINYNDNYTHTSTMSMDFNSFGFPVSIDGTTQRTNFVDGWGSVTTPAGTYANVLRMKTTLATEQYIVYEGDEIPVQSTTVTYKWLDPAHGVPVLEATGSEAGNTFIPLRVTFFGQALKVQTRTFENVNLYPNPTSGELHLSEDIPVDKVDVFDMLGTRVGQSLDISNLATGVYFVKIKSGDANFTRKVVRK